MFIELVFLNSGRGFFIVIGMLFFVLAIILWGIAQKNISKAKAVNKRISYTIERDC